jgi:hypothetical protein
VLRVPQKARFFIRADDVGDLTPELRVFVQTFITRTIPVSYQIIPSKFTQRCADYLRNMWREYPELVEFGQHGLCHQMTVGGRHVWREFGPERNRSEQQNIIAEGRMLLREKLGEGIAVNVFTPPQHKYNGDTIRAIAAAGYSVFSASAYPYYLHRLVYRFGRALRLSSLRHHGISYHCRRRPEAPVTEVSIAIAVDDGGSIRCPAPAFPSALMQALKQTEVVGLLFHHAVYGQLGGTRELTAIADALAGIGAGRFHRLSSLGS